MPTYVRLVTTGSKSSVEVIHHRPFSTSLQAYNNLGVAQRDPVG